MNDMISKKALIVSLILAVCGITSGCAVKGSSAPSKNAPVDSAEMDDLPPPDNNDPIESVNRGIFKFNEVVDGLLLKPAAHIYLGLVPPPVRTSVKNALTNLSAPVVFLNSAFQGDENNAGRTFGRFILNSTLGIAGIFDVATDLGIPKEHKKDFGQTLGVRSVGSGPFLEIPILGPSNTRDAFGMIVDIAMDPFTYIFNQPITITIDSTRIVDRRAELLPVTDRIYRDSLDPYASIRSVYQQHREKVVQNYLSSDTAEVDTAKKK